MSGELAATPASTATTLPSMRECLAAHGVPREHHIAAMEAFTAWMRARCPEAK